MNGRIAYYKAVFQYQDVAGSTNPVFSYGRGEGWLCQTHRDACSIILANIN